MIILSGSEKSKTIRFGKWLRRYRRLRDLLDAEVWIDGAISRVEIEIDRTGVVFPLRDPL